MNEKIVASISQDRFETYLRAAGFDPNRALELYYWNLEISASFYPLLAGVEISLRNQIETRLDSAFGPSWWVSSDFSENLGAKGSKILNKAVRNLHHRRQQITSGRVTAELSFGFWRNMLLPKYEATLWSPISPHFPNLPANISRQELETRCERIRSLRNRISHHEPLLKRDISKDYSQALQVLRWMSPEKANWIKPRLETMRILRRRP